MDIPDRAGRYIFLPLRPGVIPLNSRCRQEALIKLLQEMDRQLLQLLFPDQGIDVIVDQGNIAAVCRQGSFLFSVKVDIFLQKIPDVLAVRHNKSTVLLFILDLP